MTRTEKYWINHKVINGVLHRRCSGKCQEWKPETIDYFYMRNKKKPKMGLCAECIECTIKINTARILSNLVKKKIWNDRWNHKPDVVLRIRESSERQRKAGKQKQFIKDNPHKAQKYVQNHQDHDITDTEWENVLKIFDYKCAYCGKTLVEQIAENGVQFHKEHVWCYGANDIRNCIPACTSCNDTKWMRTIYEWYNPSNPKFEQWRYDKIIKWITEDYMQYIEEKKPKRKYK